VEDANEKQSRKSAIGISCFKLGLPRIGACASRAVALAVLAGGFSDGAVGVGATRSNSGACASGTAAGHFAN
jgi:hypothetical protein